jgi:hypothetical protein
MKKIPAFRAVKAFGDVRECESVGERGGIDTQDAGFLGAIEIEATGFVAIANSKRNEVHILHIAFTKAEEFTAGPTVQILNDGHRALAKQSKAAGAGGFLESVEVGIETEDADGRNEE